MSTWTPYGVLVPGKPKTPLVLLLLFGGMKAAAKLCDTQEIIPIVVVVISMDIIMGGFEIK
jgi:hypothetical protein